MENLSAVITDLIKSKREGQYWDFKVTPHDNNAALVHDILCLANACHKGNRFLIFGVSDPSEGAEITGLNFADLPTRKTQQQYIDLLRSKDFAGDIRPEVELHTLIIENKEIDVLIVFNHPLKPYYLTKNYPDGKKQVLANYIYTRIGDTNTPINQSADLVHIERMWREKFFLDLTPVEKMKFFLKDSTGWYKDLGNADYAYNKLHPEYNIQFVSLKKFSLNEAFCYYYLDPNAYLGIATFRYHSTILFEYEYMACDGMRIYLPTPKISCVEEGRFQQYYFYYCLEEIDGIFLQFMTDNSLSFSTGRGSEPPFLIFKSKAEQETFNTDASYLLGQILKISPNGFAEIARTEKERANNQNVIDPIFLDQINQFYRSRWKKGLNQHLL